MDLREYLALSDSIATVRTSEDVVAVVARITAAGLGAVDRRVLGRRLAAATHAIDPALAAEVAVDLSSEVDGVEGPPEL